MRSRPVLLLLANVALLFGVTLATVSPALAAVPAGPTAVAPPTAQPMVTLLFSRTPLGPTARCQIMPGSVPLETTLQNLAARGMTATGSVVTGDVRETEDFCNMGMQTPSWATLARLTSTYGMVMVSAGKKHTSFPAMDAATALDDSCGALPTFVAHGYTRANGLFMPASGQILSAQQDTIVHPCYAATRTYGRKVNMQGTTLHGYAVTKGITGGGCNDPLAACYTAPVKYSATRYDSPVALAALVQGGTGSWALLQAYALVSGSSPGQWDCTSPAWQSHWTAAPEWYCDEDYQTVLNAIPVGTKVTDPLTVAEAWGGVH